MSVPQPPTSASGGRRRTVVDSSALAAVAVTYPGYNPAGPYAWPLAKGQVTSALASTSATRKAKQNRPMSQRDLVNEVLRWNGHTIKKYGVKKDVMAFLLSVPMQLFMLDAFWWIFLEHFSAVDFHAMVERTRRGALVSDSDVMTYMGSGGPSSSQPKRPVKKLDGDGKDRVVGAYQDKVTGLPAHVSGTRGRLRDAEDVVRVSTPTLTRDKLRDLATVLGNPTGVAVDSDDEASIASTTSLEYSPSEMSSGTARSQLSAQSAGTVDGLLRVTRFSTTFPSLTKLPPEVRGSVIAREQHQLFTRMASHYARAVQILAPRHFTIKDAVTRIMPDLIAQCIFAAFWKSIPYAVNLFDLQFQKDIASTVSMWIGGVVKTPSPRSWPTHHMLDTVYKRGNASNPAKAAAAMKKKLSAAKQKAQKDEAMGSQRSAVRLLGGTTSQTGSVRTARVRVSDSSSPRTAQGGASARSSGRPPVIETALPLSGTASPGDVSRRSSVRASAVAAKTPLRPAGTNKAGATGRSTRVIDIGEPAETSPGLLSPAGSPKGGGGSSVSLSLGQGGPVPTSELTATLDDAKEFLLTPDQRRERAVAIEVAAMRQDLTRLTTTHTFSQVHYSRETRGRADDNVKAPGRTAKVFQVGPQKRTVQVIKADLDAKYRENAPWYGNPKIKTRRRDQTGTAKFALSNWSPLLHRFMLSNGAENHGRPDSIKWTV